MRLKQTLEEIYTPIQRELGRIDGTILGILATDNPLSSRVIDYFFSAKGKSLRPALCLFGASFSEDPGAVEKAIPVAAALEIFHAATLIHDDIVDGSRLRRNRATVNAKWGAQAAVLMGDYLHDRAMTAFFETRNERLFSLLLKTACDVCDGEILEFSEKENLSLTEERYLGIIRKKTAVLFSACVEAGALVAELGSDDVFALLQYGMDFGMAFQIVDDCLDFMGDSRAFGKNPGSDCDAEVLTLPLIRALALAPQGKKEEALRVFRSNREDKFSYLKRLVFELGAIEYAMGHAKNFSAQAISHLAFLKTLPVRHSLEALSDFMIERTK